VKNLFFTAILLSSTSLLASTNIKQVKDNLSNYQNQLNKMEAELNQIDKELSQYNLSFLEDQGKLKEVESTLHDKKENLSKTAEEISKKYTLAKKAYLNYLMEATDSDNENQIFRKKIYSEVLKVKLNSLSEAQKKSQAIMAAINNSEKKIENYRKDEDSIYQYIISLENKKKTIGENYIDTMEKRNSLQTQLDKLLARQKAYRSAKKAELKSGSFGLPLNGFQNIKKGKNGLTLNYQGTQPVMAPAAGRVVYVGELASYGQVIMIDHGKDIKSVLLGDIQITTKKGDAVKLNQILGYTISDEEITKSVYFEIRKKNKAQDTAKWISSTYQKQII